MSLFLTISQYNLKCNLYTGLGRKEMFYLMTHLTHFIYGYMVSHTVKDQPDSERVNQLP